MKTSKINLSTLAMAALCLAFFTWLPAQSVLALQQEQDVQLGENQEYGQERGDKKGNKGTELIGKNVVNQEGQQLGTIEDIAVDLQNSRITYVLISEDATGEMEHDPMQQDPMQDDPIDEDPTMDDPAEQDPEMQDPQMAQSNGQFKAVPPQALRDEGKEELVLDIDQQQWAQAPTFDKQELAQRGMDEQQGQEIYAFYDQQWDTGDLSLLQQDQQDQAEAIPPQQEEQDPIPGPAVQQQSQAMDQEMQQETAQLKYIDELKGKKVVTQAQEEIGEVDEFLMDLEEGRLAFVIVSATNGMGEKHQENGFGQQQEQDTDMDTDMEEGVEDQETFIPGEDPAERNKGDRYAIAPNAFEDSPEQDQLIVHIDSQELEQAQALHGDEWINGDMETLGQSSVFRYEEEEGDALGAQEEPYQEEDDNGWEDDEDWEPNGGESQMQQVQQDQPRDAQADPDRDSKRGHKASDLKGKDVVNEQDENLGTIEDLAVELQNSRITYVVVAEGGLLGIGEEYKIVPPQAFRFSPEEDQYVLDIDEQRWTEAQSFGSREDIAQMVDEAQTQEIYAFWGQQYQREDLGFLDEGMPEDDVAEIIPENGEPEGGPAAQDYQGQQEPQEMIDELQFTDEMTGMSVVSAQQEDVGDVDDFLIDLGEGRLAFAILKVSDDFLGREGDPQQQQEMQTQIGQDNQYAVAPGALRYSPEDEQLILEIDREEFVDVEHIDSETWIDQDRDLLGQHRVFRYEERAENDWGAMEQEDNGYGEEGENGWVDDDDDWEPNGGASQMHQIHQDHPQNAHPDKERDGKKGHKTSDLIGKDITNEQDENLGSIQDFAVDLQNSRITYVVVSEGGLLGIGEELKAVPPQALRFSAEDEQFVLDVDQQRWENAPTFESKDELAQAVDEAQAQEIYAFFDQQYQREDLGFLQMDDQAEALPGQQDQDTEIDEGGPALQDQQGQEIQDQMGQEQMEELKFVDEMTGNSVVSEEQEDIGDVEDFLVDLQEGRLAFVVVNISDDFVSQMDDRDMGAGADQPTQQPQQEGDQPIEQEDHAAQQQQGMQQQNQYAIAANAFRVSPEDENQLILNIERSEFEQAQMIDSETWIDQDMDMLAQHRVFRYEEKKGNDWGAVEQPEEGYQEETGTHRDDQTGEERDTDNGTTTGQEAGVVQDQDNDRADRRDQEELDDQQRADQQMGRQGAKASELLGNNVVNHEDNNLGSLNDLAIDFQNSRVVYALVRSGGFLGIGATLRALPPQALQRSGEEQQLVVNIDEERWKNAPSYNKDELAQMTDETQGQEIYAYFDQQWDTGDLGMRREDQAELRERQREEDADDNDIGGPAPVDTVETEAEERERREAEERAEQDQLREQQPQADVDVDRQEQQPRETRLGFADNLMGSNITGINEEEIGEIEDFLVDLETGRAAFVVFTASDNFLQTGDAGGMDTGYDEGTEIGTEQEQEPDETGMDQDVTGRDQQEQAREGMQFDENGNNRYAVTVNAFRISSDGGQLILEDIDRNEFDRAESLDERWMDMDMEIMAENRVFRFHETDDATAEMGTGRGQPENGIFRDRDRDRDDDNDDDGNPN